MKFHLTRDIIFRLARCTTVKVTRTFVWLNVVLRAWLTLQPRQMSKSCSLQRPSVTCHWSHVSSETTTCRLVSLRSTSVTLTGLDGTFICILLYLTDLIIIFTSGSEFVLLVQRRHTLKSARSATRRLLTEVSWSITQRLWPFMKQSCCGPTDRSTWCCLSEQVNKFVQSLVNVLTFPF